MARLDIRLVERGLVRSRARAQDLIRRGLVEIAGVVETRPGARVAADAAISLSGAAEAHVSRGASKLIAALDHFRFPVAGVVALDIGASTGGFTEVLLDRGAARVYAVDVGHDQLHARLAADPRVVSLEDCDARRLDRDPRARAGRRPRRRRELHLADEGAARAADADAPGAWLVALIKPQFEAGRAAVGKGGIVRDPAARQRAVALVRDWMAGQPDWRVLGVIASPIAGGSGNEEFLLGATRGG